VKRLSFQGDPHGRAGAATQGRRSLHARNKKTMPRLTPLQRGLLGAATTLLLPLLEFAVPNAQAARPFATEDAGVLPTKSCEVEVVASGRRVRGAPSAQQEVVQAACGWGASSQLGLALGRVRVQGESERATLVFGKTGVIDGGEDRVSVSLAYSAEMARWSTGGDQRLAVGAVALVASLPLGAGGLIHANLGHQRQQELRRRSSTWALAWEYPLSKSFDIGVERYGDDRTPAWWGVGLRWTLSTSFSLNAAAAKESASAGAREVSAGLRFAF
jgi:hypothetical protein